jgi:hypothetical protein
LQNYKWLVAILVFAASALTALHKGLDCEAYHAECRHAIHNLRSIIEGLEATTTLDAKQLQSAIAELEVRLKQYRERAFDTPPKFIGDLLPPAGKPSVHRQSIDQPATPTSPG